MCLKQNPKIKRWREETIKKGKWEEYGEKYRIARQDVILVETGIKDLVENYFLNNPTETSPEKVATHYYCVMLARSTIDYFLSVFCESTWQSPQEWGNRAVVIKIKNQYDLK